VKTARIAELLTSYVVGLTLPPSIYDQLSAYLDLLLRWNAKTNLSAIRDPEQIVTRHFGESLFAAGVLFGKEPSALGLSSRANPEHGRGGVEGTAVSDNRQLTPDNCTSDNRQLTADNSLADLGSGAGFPGIPIKLAFPELHVTLIESQNKKATFLKEVIRCFELEGIEVYNGRAEQWGKQADVVTLRAVEKFESALTVAAKLVKPGGRLCLLMGAEQRKALVKTLGFSIRVEQYLPNRSSVKVVVGNYY